MHGPPVTNRKTVFVEVVILADNSLYTHYRRKQAGALERVEQVLSVANRVRPAGCLTCKALPLSSPPVLPHSLSVTVITHCEYIPTPIFHLRYADDDAPSTQVLGGVGVVLVPADVQVWDRRDEFRVTSSLETNINALQRHRMNLLQQYPDRPNDHTVLLT